MSTILKVFPAVVTFQTAVVIPIPVVLEYVSHDEFIADLAPHSELVIVTFLTIFLITPGGEQAHINIVTTVCHTVNTKLEQIFTQRYFI